MKKGGGLEERGLEEVCKEMGLEGVSLKMRKLEEVCKENKNGEMDRGEMVGDGGADAESPPRVQRVPGEA